MSSSGRSGEARGRRSPANDDPVPTLYSSIPPRRLSPPVMVSSVPCSIQLGNSMFQFDPVDGSVRRVPPAESPPFDRDYEGLNLFFGTTPPTATSRPRRFVPSSATGTTGADHTNRGRNETRRAAPNGEGSKKSSSERSASTTSGGGNLCGSTSSGTGATSAPPPPRPAPEQNNKNSDNIKSDVQVEEEEEVLQESKLLLGMPQNPHYRPLLHHPKSLRQYLIAGYDKSLVEVGGRIQKLTPAEFERSKEDMRGALEELVKMGYDVGPWTRRLDALEEEVETAAREGNKAREKKQEARRKMVEKEEELRQLKADFRRVQIKIEEKQEGIEELQKWEKELEERIPDVEGVFARMARTPVVV